MIRKKSVIIIIIIALAVCVGVIAVIAAGQIAKSNSISGETALKFACADSDIKEADIVVLKNEFGSGNGVYFYDILFSGENGEYSYKVNARTGQILDRSVPKKSQQTEKTIPESSAGEQTDTAAAKADTPVQKDNNDGQGAVIGVEKAKETALEHAGVQAADVIFSKAKQEREDGIKVYELEFFISGKAEYEYIINALTGEIMEHHTEPWDADDGTESPAPTQTPAAQAEEPSVSTQDQSQAEPPSAPTQVTSDQLPEEPAYVPSAPETVPSDSNGHDSGNNDDDDHDDYDDHDDNDGAYDDVDNDNDIDYDDDDNDEDD